MSINIKKYTKEQMAKMMEMAQEEAKEAIAYGKQWSVRVAELNDQVRTLKQRNVVLTESVEQMNGEAINKANEIANLKADADALRNKLADAEAALGRANAAAAQQTAFAEYHKREYDAMVEKYKTAALEEWRAKNHPFRNLWAWVKRRLGCKV